MKEDNSEMLMRLEGLEQKVSELQSLIQKLVKWTNFREDGCGDESSPSLVSRNKITKGQGKVRIGPKSRVKKTAVNEDVQKDKLRKKDSSAPSFSLKTKTTPRKTGSVAKKSTTGVPKIMSCSTTNLSDSFNETHSFVDDVSIKEESMDMYSTAGFILCPSSPPAPVLEDEDTSSFTFEIQGTDDDYAISEEHSSSENEEEIKPGDDSKTEHTQIKNPLKPKRRYTFIKRSKPSTEKPKRIYKYRGPKLIVQPLSKRIKPPFVRLNRIDAITLKEKFGIEPGPPKKWPCPICNEKFPTEKGMWKHKKIHPKVYKRYTCSFCGKVHVSKSKHNDHVNSHTGARPHLCHICGYAGRSRSVLRSHMQLIHFETEKKIQCEVCSVMLKTKGSLRTHMKLMHSEPGEILQLPCDECGAVFKAEDKLKRHKKEIHTIGRRFQCLHCEKSFKRPQHLAAHTERHEAGGLRRNRMLKEEYDKRKKGFVTTKVEGNETKSETEAAVDEIPPPDSDPFYIGEADEDLHGKDDQDTQKIFQPETSEPCSSIAVTEYITNQSNQQQLDIPDVKNVQVS